MSIKRHKPEEIVQKLQQTGDRFVLGREPNMIGIVHDDHPIIIESTAECGSAGSKRVVLTSNGVPSDRMMSRSVICDRSRSAAATTWVTK